jgi:hypothetical protein
MRGHFAVYREMTRHLTVYFALARKGVADLGFFFIGRNYSARSQNSEVRIGNPIWAKRIQKDQTIGALPSWTILCVPRWLMLAYFMLDSEFWILDSVHLSIHHDLAGRDLVAGVGEAMKQSETFWNIVDAKNSRKKLKYWLTGFADGCSADVTVLPVQLLTTDYADGTDTDRKHSGMVVSSFVRNLSERTQSRAAAGTREAWPDESAVRESQIAYAWFRDLESERNAWRSMPRHN